MLAPGERTPRLIVRFNQLKSSCYSDRTLAVHHTIYARRLGVQAHAARRRLIENVPEDLMACLRIK